MTKKHKHGAGSGDPDQAPGRRRGPETSNGYTASTGRGRVDNVVYLGTVGQPGKTSRLRAIADVIRGKHRKK